MLLRAASFLLFIVVSSPLRAAGNDSLTYTYRQISDSVAAKQLGYKTLSMRAKLQWSTPQTSQDLHATIRMAKDSLIWLSLGSGGIEAARVLLTPDSFRIIYKLSNEYSIKEFDYLRQWLLFPVSFTMFQQLLAGERITIDEGASAITAEDSALALYCESNFLYQKTTVNPLNYTMRQLLLKDKMLQQDMAVTFDAYNLFNGKPFAYKRMINVNQGNTSMQLQMEIIRLSADESLAFPFEINSKLKKVE
ncbi:MAG: DUF4292 domain-containing protein [Chitinophagales bacterium]|nr:DUF4292 domain-containing protein [Chitinophagales bacterium]